MQRTSDAPSKQFPNSLFIPHNISPLKKLSKVKSNQKYLCVKIQYLRITPHTNTKVCSGETRRRKPAMDPKGDLVAATCCLKMIIMVILLLEDDDHRFFCLKMFIIDSCCLKMIIVILLLEDDHHHSA